MTSASIWTLFPHIGIYVMATGSLIPAWIRDTSVPTSSGANLPD